jgi:hypothetical protein
MAHSSTSCVLATTQTRPTSSPSAARTPSQSCLSCVPATFPYSPCPCSPSDAYTDRHVCRPSRLLFHRLPHHHPSLVPTRRFSLFIRPMVHRVRKSQQQPSYEPPRVLISSRRLTAATSNFGLHLLTKSPDADEDIFPFGGGLSGHHGLVTDMTFCGGPTDDAARYVATVSGAPRVVRGPLL